MFSRNSGPSRLLSDGVSATFQQYADRGVFRGLRASPAARERVEYHFTWLFRRPMHAVFDRRRSVLTFPALFPRVDTVAPIPADLRALVTSRGGRQVAAHKRLDARRARITGTTRKGDWSLTVEIRGANHEYAVRKALNVINELFVLLHERYPEYLVQQFGLSTE